MLGATVDFDTLAIHSHELPNMHIVDTPFQLLKPTMLRFAFDAVHRSLAHTRTVLKNAPKIDVDIFKQALSGREDHFQNVVRCISTLSNVEQAMQCRIGEVTSDLCAYCKSCPSSTHHIIWECSHIKLVEARNNLTDPTQALLLTHAAHLPLHLLYGIPPPLALLPSSPWWTNESNQEFREDISNDGKKFFGIDCSHSTAFLQWLQPLQHMDARAAFAQLNGGGKTLPITPLPQEVYGNPSLEPDAFSDGSFSDARHPHFALSSAAVWWPQRESSKQPLSTLEHEYALERQLQDGLEVASYIDGFVSSSTRTELLGIILALFSDLPVHLAVDSAAVLGPARRIQSWLIRYVQSLSSAQLPQSPADTWQLKPLGKHFELTSNGDLWHIFFRTLMHRGPTTVMFTKTKGHALENHSFLQEHPELRTQAVNNDRADKAAKAARTTFYNSRHEMRLNPLQPACRLFS